MMKAILMALVAWPLAQAAPVPLFDGKSLDGWNVRPGEEKWWRVEDGMITGGSLTETVPFNTFLSSAKSYGNFELTYKIRIKAGEGFANSGVQIRSQRDASSSEMAGYQVDAGAGYWGDLYDESRRNRALVKAEKVTIKDGDWNEFRVVCEGTHIRTWLNGAAAIDYTETEKDISTSGLLGLQTHGGGKVLAQFKDIVINELPSPAGGALTPAEEAATFKLPPGFTAELVASEEQGVGKPITVAWDKHGRMWTMTALEYPIDGNENQAVADELYQKGGKDRVLVFDEPNKPGPQTPRVFAEGLAIPLGLLPYGDGALVQHGSQIRHYHDTDNDGKADRYDVILEGFGVQDSHLMMHQFERMPGGWIYLAQGAFNYSKVHRPDGKPFENGATSVDLNNCKLARMRPDGSAFEAISNGPNNIWGLTYDRAGSVYIQEANDMGYPVAQFIPGTHYATFSGGKMRDDAPVLPPSTPDQPMGGTGLSGLAVAANVDSPFGQHGKSVFYISNPITSRLQIVTMTRHASGHPVCQKGDDFLVSSDPWFRPIAIHFGPDGCLYVADWYNKIISHNEIPRDHPDRDKTHGRIWRIRHESQKPVARVDVTKLATKELVDRLGDSNHFIATQAWQELADRKDGTVTAKLTSIALDSKGVIDRRLGALWSVEGQLKPTSELMNRFEIGDDSAIQREMVRIEGEHGWPVESLAKVGAIAANDTYTVRAAFINALRSYPGKMTAKLLGIAANVAITPPSQPNPRNDYDKKFERYLVRWLLEAHPAETHELLSTDIPLEARLLAIRSLPPGEAATELVKLLPSIQRPLNAEEMALLGGQLQQAEVQQAFANLLDSPDRRESTLRTLLAMDSKFQAPPALSESVGNAMLKLLEQNRSDDGMRLAIALARRFHIGSLQEPIAAWLTQPGRTAQDLTDGFNALREMGNGSPKLFIAYLDHDDAQVRLAAVAGLASAGNPTVIDEFTRRWGSFTIGARQATLSGLASKSDTARALAKSIAAGQFQGADGSAFEAIINSLGAEDPDVAAMLKSKEGLVRPLLQFGNGGPGRLVTELTLHGPFTIEAWVRLPGPIDNNDGVFGNQGGPDINFAGARLRIYGGDGVGDLIIADRAIEPNRWTHCAITRDSQNRFEIYLNGEPDPAASREFADDFTHFNLGESHRGKDTVANYDEVRVWNVARSADEIRRDVHTRLAGEAPAGLVMRIAGDAVYGKFEGKAAVTHSLDFPALLSPTESKALDEKFAKFRKLAEAQGDAAAGKQLVQATCMICHQIRGEGNLIGPNLSGAGAMGTESLLRNILTPNAQLESAYYRHDIKLHDGTLLSGFLADENERTLTLRRPGADERVINRSEVASHEISKLSLMPEGLIDGFAAQQVSDLFAYLKTLR